MNYVMFISATGVKTANCMATIINDDDVTSCKNTSTISKNLDVVVLRFYGPVNPMGSCRARSVYLTTRLLGRHSPPSG